ncbi:anaerobic ribonucleoside-triphosphate reductase-activating protein [Celerinatantimonas yamalensis]|uniref:Anaerobic ribonucleoside-triphosphate reductase-activating protein n=1 Tax=Celerinatantimonas yamalensis TaxID=559956 RepID=A0ABW9G2R2_9GAMM
MNYCQYYPVDVVNGPGTRSTLFVAGCEHMCRGCYNQSTWRLDVGHKFDEKMQQQIIDDLNDPEIPKRGLSLSGGDPLHPANVIEILALIEAIREHCPGKDIWCWTGYQIESLSLPQWQVVKLIDVLVDGPFKQEQRSPQLPWRGSANQRIIDVEHWLNEH